MHQPSLRSLLILFLVATSIVLGQGVIAPAHGLCTPNGKCGCGDRVISNTVLTSADPILKGNSSCPCNGLVVAPNVTKLIVNGTIKAQPGNVCAGILLEAGVTKALITQGAIKGFQVGIDASGGVTGTTFSRFQIFSEDNAFAGIALVGNNNLLTDNTFTGFAPDGAINLSGNGNTVQSNDLGESGIFADGTKNVISRNVATGGRGFVISGLGATVNSNTATEGFGFSVEGTGHQFTRNTAQGNFLGAFDVSGTNHIFNQNTSRDNGFDGFFVSGTGHTFTRNVAVENEANGFSVSGRNHTFTLNRATTSELFDGLFVDATGSTFTSNTSTSNAEFGIEDVSRGGGTSGTANTYPPGSNGCSGNSSGNSTPAGLC